MYVLLHFSPPSARLWSASYRCAHQLPDGHHFAPATHSQIPFFSKQIYTRFEKSGRKCLENSYLCKKWKNIGEAFFPLSAFFIPEVTEGISNKFDSYVCNVTPTFAWSWNQLCDLFKKAHCANDSYDNVIKIYNLYLKKYSIIVLSVIFDGYLWWIFRGMEVK